MLWNSFQQFLPILVLILVVAFVLARLPKVELGHSPEFLRRRVWNWLPLGLTYAFLYMGRYNLNVAKNALGDVITIADFNTIFMVGTWVYGLSFIVNGPLADKWGGRRTILISSVGAAIANLEIETLQHKRPTFHGDTIYAETRVLDKVESSSKPDRGIVSWRWEMVNQEGAVVLSILGKQLFLRRSAV